MFCSVILLKTVAQKATFQIPLRNCAKDIREEPGCVGSFVEKQKHVVEHQKITATHKTQAPQVNDFCVFLSMGR